MQLIGILAAAATAVAGGQFNLNCSGTVETIVPSLLEHKTEPYTSTYRMDLGAGKWCSGSCQVQFDFASVTPIALVLEDKDVDTISERDKLHHEISRETGEDHTYSRSGRGALDMSMVWRGHCEKAPFTGFPAVETKF